MSSTISTHSIGKAKGDIPGVRFKVVKGKYRDGVQRIAKHHG